MYLILHFISSSTEIFCILSLNPDQDYLPSFCSSFLPPSVFILSIIITYVYSFKDIRVNQKGQISLLFRILYSSGGGHTINNKHNKLYSVWEGDVSSVSSVAQSCPTLCDPMNRSTPGLPVHHQTPWNLFKLMPIKSVMPSSHLILLWSPSSPAPNPSQHQGLFQGVNSSHEVAKVLEFQLQHQSFQWTLRTNLL